MNSWFVLDVGSVTLSEENGVESSWVHALPLGDYKHPLYGTISINAERAKRFAENVVGKVRGIDPSINYVHDNNNVAAGWVKNAESRADGLWLFVEWVKDAAAAIKDKKWRYFSSEFADEWEDSKGVKFKDVILGGALTNRPFMKNLVPVNLSEETYDLAFDLISAATGKDVEALKGGNMPLSEDDLKKIVEGVATKLTESKVNDPSPTANVWDDPALKQLAEENPLVKALMNQVESTKTNSIQTAQQLREAEIAHKLAEFDNSKIVMTPVARELAKQILLKLDDGLQEPFWRLLTEMKRGSSFLVELGERSGATVNYGSPKSAKQQLDDLAKTIKNERKLSDVDAMEAAVAENPALYARYRSELMEGANS